MNDSIQDIQTRALLAKAAEKCDEAQARIGSLEATLRHEKRWCTIFQIIDIVLALALFFALSY